MGLSNNKVAKPPPKVNIIISVLHRRPKGDVINLCPKVTHENQSNSTTWFKKWKKGSGVQMARNITVEFGEAKRSEESVAVAIRSCHFHFMNLGRKMKCTLSKEKRMWTLCSAAEDWCFPAPESELPPQPSRRHSGTAFGREQALGQYFRSSNPD